MKRKRTCILVVLVMLITTLLPATAFAYDETNINVTIDSKSALVDGIQNELDAPATIINGRTMVPIRFVAESLGISVEWDKQTKSVIVNNGEILLPIGANQATVNGAAVSLDSSPVLVNNRTLVPIRFVAETLGAKVDWDSKSKTATIRYSEQLNLARDIYKESVSGENQVLSSINAQYGWDYAKKLATIGSAKDDRGFHMAGTEKGKEAMDLAFDTFKSLGYEPEYDQFPVYGWNYIDASLSLKDFPEMKLDVVAQPGTVASPEAGIQGEIVFVGGGTKDELEGVDLSGKIALIAIDGDQLTWMSQAAQQLSLHNAAAVVYYWANYYNQDESGDAHYVADWLGPELDIPVLSITKKNGIELSEFLKKQTGVQATLISDVEINKNATGYNVMASIPGAKYPDEYVTISAHSDAYFYGFQDDSLAVGLIMSLAKAMKETNYKPDRTILFVVFDAEEFGAMNTHYDWLIGSWNFLKDKIGLWDGKMVGNINLELMAWKDTDKFHVRSSDTLYSFINGTMNNFKTSGFSQGVEMSASPSTWSDEWSYSYYGIPSIRTKTDPRVTEEIYHSALDNEANASFPKYKDCVNAYSTILMRMEKIPSMPYDLGLTPIKYLAGLDQEALSANNLDDSLSKACTSYQGKASTLMDKNLEITDLYLKALKEGKDLAQVDALLPAYNQKLRDAAKTVITGTQYLDLEVIMYPTPFYQGLPDSFQSAIDSLKAGKGQEMLDNFSISGTWYVPFMEYEVWYDYYKEAIDYETLGTDLRWGTDRELKNYNTYSLIESVHAKVKAGDTDFSDEMKILAAMKVDSQKRLATAYKNDKAVWVEAEKQLPLELADKILALLK